MNRDLTDAEYAELLSFRTSLRRFLQWSEEQATALGITPAQHQLLLAIRGYAPTSGAVGPTIGDVAGALLLRHHSAVGLVDRAVAANLVERHADSEDQRIVRLRLTSLGARRLRQLAGLHLDELRRMMPAIGSALFAEPLSAEPLSAEPLSAEPLSAEPMSTEPEGAS
jgi:DNA-binding MarR family transcriptional regulator